MLGAWGGGASGFNASREAAFAASVQATLDEDPEDALEAAYVYLRGSSSEDTRVDRAQMLFAQAAQGLSLSYVASLYYLDVAESRRDVDQLDKAFAGLERIVMGSAPHDTATLVDGFLASAHITGLSPERQAFIDFLQGRRSLAQGLDAWGDKQLSAIPRRSPYWFRARYVQAVRSLYRGAFDVAKAALEALREAERAPREVVLDAELALARLAMEQERSDDAVAHYEAVRPRAKRRPELLLEMAWAHYYRGDSRRSLGLLVALDAPVYGGLIAPERYLLEARVLRRLCQFEPARTAAVRLSSRHGPALRDVHAGLTPAQSQSLGAGARQRGEAREAFRFRALLERERLAVREAGFSAALEQALLRVYERGLSQARAHEQAAVEREGLRLAAELLAAEDGVRLTLHELSVGLLRGRRRPPGPLETESVKIESVGDQTSYRFVGEFWTDELDDLVVVIPDRCLQ